MVLAWKKNHSNSRVLWGHLSWSQIICFSHFHAKIYVYQSETFEQTYSSKLNANFHSICRWWEHEIWMNNSLGVENWSKAHNLLSYKWKRLLKLSVNFCVRMVNRIANKSFKLFCFRTLNSDFLKLKSVDGMDEWRKKESQELTNLVQRRFHYLQVQFSERF